MGNALKSMPSFEVTDSDELDVGGRPFVFLLLNGADAVRRASPMLDRLFRSVNVDFLVYSSAGGDIPWVDSEYLEINVNGEVRFVLIRICGIVVVNAGGCSSWMDGCSTLREIATFDLLGKTSYVGLRCCRADSLFTEIVIGRRRPISFSAPVTLLKISLDNECDETVGSATGELADLRLVAETRFPDFIGMAGGCGMDAGRGGVWSLVCVLMDIIDGRV